MYRSPYSIKRGVAQPQTREAILSLLEISRLVKELETLKEKTQAEHTDAQSKREQEHAAALQEIKQKVSEAHAHIRGIAKGEKGDPGQNGKDGAPGKDGKDGESIVGPAGKDGKDGKDAEPLDPQVIIDLILEKKFLKPEHIDGLTEEIASYRAQLAGQHYGSTTMVRGGGDTVAAGTGVTITTVNGVKTISASSSGFTTLTATETPDGSATVFTFAAAAAQPSYLVVDNVWLRPTTAKGTVNWTWNAGLKQATLTSPAADEIFGIV